MGSGAGRLTTRCPSIRFKPDRDAPTAGWRMTNCLLIEDRISTIKGEESMTSRFMTDPGRDAGHGGPFAAAQAVRTGSPTKRPAQNFWRWGGMAEATSLDTMTQMSGSR